jgi:iron complex transport system permease protein
MSGDNSGGPRRLPLLPTILACALFLFACLTVAGGVGDTPLPPSAVARSIGHHLLPGLVPLPAAQPSPLDPTLTLTGEDIDGIVWPLRVPRVLLAALVGAALSVAGVALQGLLGNPLADPYVIGVSSGAAVGAAAALLFGVAGLLGGLGLPLCAFGVALLTMLVVFALSRSGGRVQTTGFLLSGIVAGSFLWSVVTLFLALAGPDLQPRILDYLMGRFTEADWRKVGLLAPFALGGGAVFWACGRGLDAFSFGEETARSLGVEVERFKAGVLALSALVTAASVAVSGIIGFVGLVVPHAARALVGPPHRGVLPVAALLGASLTVLADLAARTLRPGQELPVGVVTALIGAPFFFVLLRRQMGQG